MNNQDHRQVDVAQAVSVFESVVFRALERLVETGSAIRRPGSRLQHIIPQKDRNILIAATRIPFHSSWQILNMEQDDLARFLCTQTIRNWLGKDDLLT